VFVVTNSLILLTAIGGQIVQQLRRKDTDTTQDGQGPTH